MDGRGTFILLPIAWLLMTLWRKATGHQQPRFWGISPWIYQYQIRKSYYSFFYLPQTDGVCWRIKIHFHTHMCVCVIICMYSHPLTTHQLLSLINHTKIKIAHLSSHLPSSAPQEYTERKYQKPVRVYKLVLVILFKWRARGVFYNCMTRNDIRASCHWYSAGHGYGAGDFYSQIRFYDIIVKAKMQDRNIRCRKI